MIIKGHVSWVLPLNVKWQNLNFATFQQYSMKLYVGRKECKLWRERERKTSVFDCEREKDS